MALDLNLCPWPLRIARTASSGAEPRWRTLAMSFDRSGVVTRCLILRCTCVLTYSEESHASLWYTLHELVAPTILYRGQGTEMAPLANMEACRDE